jgi:hypothetical protein
MNQISNEQNNQKIVFPLSLNAAEVVVDIIEGWNVIKCRICEEKKRSKFADHFATHFDQIREVPMTVQEIMNLVVPQIEK